MHTLRSPRSRALAPLAALLAVALLAPAAHATKGPPVKVQIVPPAMGQLPLPGQNYAITLRVTSAVAASLQDFSFASDRVPGGGYAWDVVSLGIPPGTPVAVQPMVPLDIPCVLLANDPTVPVRVTLYFNGRRRAHTFSLLPRYGPAGVLPAGSAVAKAMVRPELGPPPPPLPMEKSAYYVPAPVPSPRPKHDPATESPRQRAENAPRDGEKRRGYNITVHGRFVYNRPDGGRGGVDGCTIRVMDEDWDWDQELAAVCTNPDGTFSASFYYDDDEDPDIYLEMEAANTKVEVEDASVFEWNYMWYSHVIENSTASDVNFGTFTTADEALAPALSILSMATRTFRWFLDCDGEVDEDVEGLDSVDIQWPEDGVDTSCYTYLWELIEINSAASWKEITISHEYNHHASEHLYPDDIDDYCNEPERCDNDGCGHCLWCQESLADAWGEGFGDFVAASVLRLMLPVYNERPMFMDSLMEGNYYNLEWPHACTFVDPESWDDPALTEGNVAGILLDIEDWYNDNTSSHYGGADELTMPRSEIVGINANHDTPDINTFLVQYAQLHPELRNQIWATAKLHGIDTDGGPPGVVTNLASASHPINVEVPDHTATLTWNTAPDDWSGIEGYSVQVSTSATSEPDYTKDIGKVTSYTTPDMGTGTHYFTIRAYDRAGHWCGTSVRYGPMRTREPYPADLGPIADTGWDYPLVPRASSGATENLVASPTVLAGNDASTWWNLCVRNTGELAAPYGWHINVYLDGGWYSAVALPTNLAASAYEKWLNRGPMTVRGGRHMFSAKSDPLEEYSEMNEADNDFARQWIWSPLTLSNNVATTRSAPPDRFGGVLDWNMYYSYNCDGLRSVNSSGQFAAVSVRGVDDDADYDCRLHPASMGATSGFTTLGSLGSSSRPAGRLDAVIMPVGTTYDIGVINMNDHWTDYVATKTYSASLAFNSATPVTVPSGQYLRMLHFDPVSAQRVTITLAGAGTSPLHLAWISSAFTAGDIDDADAQATTDSTGFAQIGPTDMPTGYQGLVIWRDPIDASPGGGTAPAVTVSVHAFGSPCDLTPNKLPGWAFQCVPRAANDGTATSVPEPSSLPGDAGSTYVNTAWRNAGTAASASYYHRVFVDGVQRASVLYAALAAGAAATRNSSAALNIAGGRHVMSLRLDSDNAVAETNDANNNFGRQWVWTPPALAIRTPTVRTAPPDPTGGLSDTVIDSVSTAYFNCDGVRMPAPSINGQHGYWQAVATMPGAASDVDLRLHETATSTSIGFQEARVASSWSPGESDFVLVNYRALATARAFDVGAVRASGTENYTVEAVASTYVATYPDGTYGPYNLAASHIINLHEVKLRAGPIAIGLVPLGDDVDFGLSLHLADRAFQAKMVETGREGWITWMRRTGEGDWLVLDVPATGLYCLAVWKAGAADLAKNGQYQVRFIDGLTEVPDAPVPLASGFAAIQPNPFNPLTTVVFDVGRAGRVQLTVYDLAGRRVRRLIDGDLQAGRRTCRWDGTDDRGQPRPSGVYVMRLAAPDGGARRTMTLVR